MGTQLFQFKAGKMTLEGKTLKPDSRKGTVIVSMGEDTLVHVQWFERQGAITKAEPEDDVIVFPDEAKVEKVPSQRVFVLKFPEEADRNMFFWLQEPNTEMDDTLRAHFQDAINGTLDPPPSGPLEPAAGDPVPSSATEHAHISEVPGAGLQVAAGGTVVQLPSGPAQLPVAPAQGGLQGQGRGAGQPVGDQASLLAALLSGALASAGAGGQGSSNPAQLAALLSQMAGGRGGPQRLSAPGPSLAEVLRPEVLAPLLAEPGLLEELGQHLPPEHRSQEQLVALAHSPQFQQQLQTFSHALQTGQLDLQQFGLNAEGFSVVDFLRAIQDAAEREQRRQQQGQGQQEGQGQAPMEQ